ncbi:right-handed parallel beta-helix repeat-containing protein [uncultured Friedmanniella sp.]|uniref:right-handed parallel beta-helix repeat-containing protein n=1 Tax=uncultured Friedmanniella sp. TaxID=335381 RepID=UPI0035CB0A9E
MASNGPRPWAARLGVGAVVLLLVLAVVIVVANQRSDRDAPADAVPSYGPGRVVVTDTFTRTVETGWGTADVGGAYDVTVPADYSVEDGLGKVTLPRPGSSRLATLSSVRTADLLTSVDILAPRPTQRGSGVYVGLQLRTNGSSYYRVTVRFAFDKRVFLSIARFDGSDDQKLVLLEERTVARGVKQGQRLNLTVALSGASPVQLTSTVKTGSAKPVQLAATDSTASRLVAGGPLALWTYVAGSSDANKTVGLDNLNVRQLSVTGGTADGDAGSGTATNGAGSLGEPVPVPADPAEAADPAGTVEDEAGDGQGHGSLPPGTTRYPVPEGAVFVSPSGGPTASGSLEDPFDTIQAAVDAAPAGATVVVRAGSYHESVLLPIAKVVHLQSYPAEEVWLEGSSVVDGWRRVGTGWEVPWSYEFDSSPTYTKGAKDRKEAGWNFVNPQFPLAAHPDQVWVDGRRLTQVGRRSQLSDDSFYVDTKAQLLVVGSDPSRAEVRASTLDKALTIVGVGDTVRGIGVRRYATSVWQLGAATVNNSGVTLENMVFADNATTGLSVFAADVTLNQLTSARNGLMGFHANQADRLVGTDLAAIDNNLEHFNRAPAAGGMKLTSSRHVQISDSEFADNEGHGLWFDVASYDVDLTGNRAERNTGSGVVLEISSRFRLVDNVALDNGLNGIWVIDTDRVEIANNTLARNEGANLVLVTDGRSGQSPGLSTGDPRRPQDPDMVWVSRDAKVYNNVLADSGSCVVCVVDYTGQYPASELQLQIDHNYYAQTAKDGVSFADWPAGRKGSSLAYVDLDHYREATGQDANSVVAPPSAGRAVSRAGGLSAAVNTVAPDVADGLSGAAAAASGGEPGLRQLGAWS